MDNVSSEKEVLSVPLLKDKNDFYNKIMFNKLVVKGTSNVFMCAKNRFHTQTQTRLSTTIFLRTYRKYINRQSTFRVGRLT